MSDETKALVLALATENAELRAVLAEAQELLIETAVDAGEMHARLEEVQRELAVARAELDQWRAQKSWATGRSESPSARDQAFDRPLRI